MQSKNLQNILFELSSKKKQNRNKTKQKKQKGKINRKMMLISWFSLFYVPWTSQMNAVFIIIICFVCGRLLALSPSEEVLGGGGNSWLMSRECISLSRENETETEEET